MSKYFPEPKLFTGKGKLELNLCNYATKSDLKNATVLTHQKLLKRLNYQA